MARGFSAGLATGAGNALQQRSGKAGVQRKNPFKHGTAARGCREYRGIGLGAGAQRDKTRVGKQVTPSRLSPATWGGGCRQRGQGAPALSHRFATPPAGRSGSAPTRRLFRGSVDEAQEHSRRETLTRSLRLPPTSTSICWAMEPVSLPGRPQSVERGAQAAGKRVSTAAPGAATLAGRYTLVRNPSPLFPCARAPSPLSLRSQPGTLQPRPSPRWSPGPPAPHLCP